MIARYPSSATASALVLPIGTTSWSRNAKFREAVITPISNLSRINRSTVVPVQGRIAPGWIVSEPLMVTVEETPNGEFVASDDLIFVYGVGNSHAEAFSDYLTSLVEYYELVALRADDDRPARELLHSVQRYIRPETL